MYKFIISSNCFLSKDNRIVSLFCVFVKKVAYVLGVDCEKFEIVNSFSSNEYIFAINAYNDFGIIDGEVSKCIIDTAFELIKIKSHISPAVSFTFEETLCDIVTIYNAYNVGMQFCADTWNMYRNNLHIDELICGIVDYISSKKNIEHIKFCVNDESVVIKDSKIFDICLPFKEQTIDYSEIVRANLLIKKADFDCNGTWEFKSGGLIIKTKIHQSQRDKLHKITRSCIMGGRYLAVDVELSCKIDVFGKCMPNTRKYEIVNILGEPREIADSSEMIFKIDKQPSSNITKNKGSQLYLI